MNTLQLLISMILKHHVVDRGPPGEDRWQWWDSFAWVPTKTETQWVWLKPIWIGERLERIPNTEEFHRPGLPVLAHKFHSVNEHFEYKLKNA